MLTMIGKRCLLLDPSGGFATHMAETIADKDVLIAVSLRYYTKEVVSIVEHVGKTKSKMIAISDGTRFPGQSPRPCAFPKPVCWQLRRVNKRVLHRQDRDGHKIRAQGLSRAGFVAIWRKARDRPNVVHGRQPG